MITVELRSRVTLKRSFKCLRRIPMKDAMDYHANIIFTDAFTKVGAN